MWFRIIELLLSTSNARCNTQTTTQRTCKPHCLAHISTQQLPQTVLHRLAPTREALATQNKTKQNKTTTTQHNPISLLTHLQQREPFARRSLRSHFHAAVTRLVVRKVRVSHVQNGEATQRLDIVGLRSGRNHSHSHRQRTRRWWWSWWWWWWWGEGEHTARVHSQRHAANAHPAVELARRPSSQRPRDPA
jgi:hypothetical protein